MSDKKLKSKVSKAKSTTAETSKSIMDSAQQIWLAGLGAFSKAQTEGAKLFDTLVQEGQALEDKTRKLTNHKVDEVRGAMESTVGTVSKRATDTWDKLEKVFEDRVSRALNGLGVPGRDEIRELSVKVDQLNAAVRKLEGSTPASKPAAKKTTAKPAAPKAASAAKKTASTSAARKPAAAKSVAGATLATSKSTAAKSAAAAKLASDEPKASS